jgi:hypothetical protein
LHLFAKALIQGCEAARIVQIGERVTGNAKSGSWRGFRINLAWGHEWAGNLKVRRISEASQSAGRRTMLSA